MKPEFWYLVFAAVIVYVFAQTPAADDLTRILSDQSSPYLIAVAMLGVVAYVGFFKTRRVGFTSFLALLFAVLLLWNGFLGFSPANPYGSWGRATGLFSMGLGILLIVRRIGYFV